MPTPALSREDQQHLATLKPKHKLICDRVHGVADGTYTGLYLWGEGGTSKSYTVLEALIMLKADYVPHNSRMTGQGLVETLQKLPTSIHVIEDCESIFDDKLAWGVLRSALWSQSKERPMRREITGTAFNTDIRFFFTGGIILIGNKPIRSWPRWLRASPFCNWSPLPGKT